MNPKKISQRSRIVNPHKSKYLPDTSIQLERFILLLDILEHKINSLDEFFAKTNEHLAAIDALNTKETLFNDETEAADLTQNHSEDNKENSPKQTKKHPISKMKQKRLRLRMTLPKTAQKLILKKQTYWRSKDYWKNRTIQKKYLTMQKKSLNN